jgi:hypothetical protein
MRVWTVVTSDRALRDRWAACKQWKKANKALDSLDSRMVYEDGARVGAVGPPQARKKPEKCRRGKPRSFGVLPFPVRSKPE